MKDEIEVKIALSEGEVPQLRKKLEVLEFSRSAPPTREENRLFDFQDDRLAGAGCALRLRRFGEKATLTYKGPRRKGTHLKIREETETEVSDFEATHRILSHLGLETGFRYVKEREKYFLPSKSVEVCIDRTPFGFFAEVEGSSEVIDWFTSELGWTRERFVTDNYVNLYRKHQRA